MGGSIVRGGLALLVVLAAACGEDPPTELVVQVTTTGSSLDTDGYVVSVAGPGSIEDRPIGTNDTIRFEVPAAVYTAVAPGEDEVPSLTLVSLGGVAANCTHSVAAPVAIVREGTSAAVAFTVTCVDPATSSGPR